MRRQGSCEIKQLFQRHILTFLEIDNALYCEIKQGDHQAKREHVIKPAESIKIDSDTLLSLWLADKILITIDDEIEIAKKALIIIQIQINKR